MIKAGPKKPLLSPIVTIILVLAPLATIIPTALAGNVSTFSDGDQYKVMDLDVDPDATNSITLPGYATVLYATASISNIDGDPVTGPQVDFGDDGSVEWAFTGKGYGALGQQTIFANGDPDMSGNLFKGGTQTSLKVLVPRDAEIKSAKIDLTVQSMDTYVMWDYGVMFDIIPQYYAAPEFGDLDGDGDLDAVVGGSYGYLTYFENDGTASNFNWTSGVTMQNQAGNDINVGYSSDPALVDIDNDNDLDLIIGAGDGTLQTYQNTGNATDPKWMNDNTLLGNADIGYYASPSFVDINNDGDKDLFCGEYLGRVAFAENTGTAGNPQFDHNAANWVWVQDNVGTIDVGYYVRPVLADIDGDSDYDLVIGEYGGLVHFKNNTGTAGSPSFTDDGNLMDGADPVYVDYMAHPALADLDDDGVLDLAIGTGNGMVDIYRNLGSATGYVLRRDNYVAKIDAGTESTPTLGDIDADGDLDLVIGGGSGDLMVYENAGNDTDPSFVLDKVIPNVTPANSAPQLVDYEGDGDLDIVVGNSTGILTYLRNIGNANNMVLQQDSTIFGSLDFGTDVKPYLADLDNDGDKDLVIGDSGYGLDYYENTGSAQTPDWDYDSDMFSGLPIGGSRTSPNLADFDGDGDHDLIVGHYYGSINYFENSGGPYGPIWSVTGAPLERIDVQHRSSPVLGDLDGDGFKDLLVGNLYGKLQIFHKIVLSKEYDVGLGFFGDPTEIWERTTTAPVTDVTVDVTSALTDQVPVSANDPDAFGNRMSTVEFTLSVTKVASSYRLHNINIIYDYMATTKDFSDNLNTYMKFHVSDIDQDGYLQVPISVKSEAKGGLNISDINIEYDAPPSLVEPIPDLGIDEETCNSTLLDLHAYFDDMETGDALLKYKIERNDFNGSIVKVSIFNNRYLSVDAIISNASQNWTGSGLVVLSAQDVLGNKVVSNEFKVTVRDINDAPWFTSEPLILVVADNLYQYDVNASDVDVEDQLMYSLEIAPVGMAINPVTGFIAWMPTNAQVAVHGVRVAVTDGEETVLQTFSVTVLGNPETNHRPQFTSFPVTVGYVGTNYEYDADALDSDPGTKLKFELVKGPSQMSINIDTGLLVWDQIIMPYIGKHTISLKVTDGVASDYQNFTLIITLNPKENKAPKFVSVPKDFAYPDENYTYEVHVDDPDTMDKDNLEVWMTVGPKGMTLENGKTLTWTPTVADIGGHVVVLGVRDLAGAEALQSFTLHVIKVDGTVAVIILSPEDGEKVSGKFKVVGALNSTVENAITLVQIRFDGKEWKDASGTKTWSYNADMTPGQHTIEVRAYDGRDHSAVTSIKVHVKDESGVAVEDSGAGALVAILLVLLVVLVILSYIIGMKKGRRTAEEEYDKTPPPALSEEAEEVKAKEERFYKETYDGREVGPPAEEGEEPGFRGATAEEEGHTYEEQPPQEDLGAEAYQEEPEAEPEPEPEPEPELEPAAEEPAFEDVEVEEETPEPEPGPLDTETTKEKEKKDETTKALDDILSKLKY